MKMKVRGQFWIVEEGRDVWLVDNEDEALALWVQMAREDRKAEIRIIEIATDRYRIKPIDWRRVAFKIDQIAKRR